METEDPEASVENLSGDRPDLMADLFPGAQLQSPFSPCETSESSVTSNSQAPTNLGTEPSAKKHKPADPTVDGGSSAATESLQSDYSARNQSIGEWDIANSCCAWASHKVKITVRTHPDRNDDFVPFLLSEPVPMFKLSMYRSSQTKWPYFGVTTLDSDPNDDSDSNDVPLVPQPQLRLYGLKIDDSEELDPVEIKPSTKPPFRFYNSKPFGTAKLAYREHSFVLSLQMPNSSLWLITPEFRVLPANEFRNREAQISQFNTLADNNVPFPKSPELSLDRACELYEALGPGADDIRIKTFAIICRRAICNNAPEPAHDHVTDLASKVGRKRGGVQPEVFAEMCLIAGKACRRVNLLKQARRHYKAGLEEIKNQNQCLALKCDLLNSLAQVLNQVEDDKAHCLQHIEEALQLQTRIVPDDPDLKSKLLIAKSRFHFDLETKRGALTEAVQLISEKNLRGEKYLLGTEYRLWKLYNCPNKKYSSFFSDVTIQDLISDVQQKFLGELEENQFEAGRLKWRLVVLHCFAGNQVAVKAGLEEIIPLLNDARMHLEATKAKYLRDLLRNSNSILPRDYFKIHGTELAPARLARIKCNLEHLACILLQH